ncbi:pyridoxal phosphate-dependent aminotransferase [Oceaniglobus roseus]|uniref:pyridoxal phosphate-dependent aminotransferase n=1 Tax=Oceaniglobus roseus TaxID=1737570 RepID=UPI000C7E9347|nr:pyridoxal phosphate-dependent aminotransferase [Kandeliimicrobium roseum]
MPDRLTPLAASLPATVPFVGPEAQERQRGKRFAARLGANESVFGPSPRAVAAMAEAAEGAWMYGDPENHDLRRALADHHGIAPEHIVVGEGIDALLGHLVRLTVGPGDTVVTSDGAYPTFNYHVTGFGGALHRVPYLDDRADPVALVGKAHDTRAKLLYLANPDNPLGGFHDTETLSAMLGALPPETLLVLDEAYSDCAPPQAIPPLNPSDPRLIRMRTFSKAYGLAGARIGYAIGPADLIAAFDRVRNHFGVNRIAQAGALAALDDAEHLRDTVAKIAQSREIIAAIARRHGLAALPSATNFVAVDCGGDGALARRVLNGLIARGLFVRMPFAAPGDRCIRISCGTAEDLELLDAHLPGALAEARAASR